MSTTVDLLKEVPLFQLLDDDERTALAESLDQVQIPSGQTVFQANEPGGTLYIIRSGKVEIFVKDDTGTRMVLEIASGGDFFGEISLLDNGPRSASAVVTEDLDALCLNRVAAWKNSSTSIRKRPGYVTVMGRRLRQDVEYVSPYCITECERSNGRQSDGTSKSGGLDR